MSERSLAVVGLGMRAGVDTAPEARAYISAADKVLYLVGDPLAAQWIAQANAAAESLGDLYVEGVARETIYAAILDKVAACLKKARYLCVAFYGHPGVFSYLGHEIVRRAWNEGVDARMLPAISAADWLFADLGVDPGAHGCQWYEATSFLLCRYRFDPSAALVLWQIGALGDATWPPKAHPRCLQLLAEYLEPYYGADHQVTIYEAAFDPVSRPLIARIPLSDLPTARTTTGSTLFVPPKGSPEANREIIDQLDPQVLALLTG